MARYDSDWKAVQDAAPRRPVAPAQALPPEWRDLAESVASRTPIPIDSEIAQQVKSAVASNATVAEAVELVLDTDLVQVVEMIQKDSGSAYSSEAALQWTINALSLRFYTQTGSSRDQIGADLRAAYEALCAVLAPEHPDDRAQVALVLLRYLVRRCTGFEGDAWI